MAEQSDSAGLTLSITLSIRVNDYYLSPYLEDRREEEASAYVRRIAGDGKLH